jgi:hypothetical protein
MARPGSRYFKTVLFAQFLLSQDEGPTEYKGALVFNLIPSCS